MEYKVANHYYFYVYFELIIIHGKIAPYSMGTCIGVLNLSKYIFLSSKI